MRITRLGLHRCELTEYVDEDAACYEDRCIKDLSSRIGIPKGKNECTCCHLDGHSKERCIKVIPSHSKTKCGVDEAGSIMREGART